MHVVVTGGAGFIGSHLCTRLLDEGHRVTCVDNLITGSLDNIEPLRSNPNFRFIQADVSQPLTDLGERVDAIFHLASPASPPGYLTYPLQTALANSHGTLNMLQLAQRDGAKFLMASTSEAYGNPLEHPQKETYWGNVNPFGMRSCYDESKRYAETLTYIFIHQYGVDARVIRIFNTYGPNSDPNDGRIVPNFIKQALQGEPITVYDEGTRTRSLCYVSDLVEGIMRVMFTQGTKGEIFNLGNPEEHTVGEYAEIIKRLADSNSEIVHVPNISKDDPSRRKPDITKARERLGWEPKVGLEEGLSRTIEWFRRKLHVPATTGS